MRGRLLSTGERGRRRLLVALGVAPAALGLAACAYRDSPFEVYAPMLWRVSRDGTGGQAWLFGSIHAGLDRFYPLPDAVERAWAGSDALAIELDVRGRWRALRAAFAERARLPGDEVIDTLIGEPAADAIRAHFEYDPLTWERLRRLQPWALTLLLSNPEDRDAGLSSRYGVDPFFLERARGRRLPVIELEQPQEQVEAFTGGSREAQVAQLLRRFGQLRHWDSLLSKTIDAWRTGDAHRLAELKSRAWGAPGERPTLRERMFGSRDRRMAARLAAVLERPTTVFTVVGAFHLAGPDALTGILGDLGLRVERIRYEIDTGNA